MSALVFGHVELRLAERQLLVHGEPVALGSRGFDLLKALVSKRDRVVGKDELLDEVWPGLVVEENNLQVQISGLRRVLGARSIATVAGLGYRFTLAPGAGASQQPPTASPQPAAATSRARVLVADDNRVNRLLLCRSLELMGHQVSSADNGRQALELLRRQPFELLLLDLAMPELDGFGLLQLRAVDAELREVAVIVTSALGGVAPVARCIELGADDFLHKPVDPWLLKARIESSLARKQHRDLQSEALRRLTPGGPIEPSRLADACVLVARLHEPQRPQQTPQELMELLSSWGTLMFDAIEGRAGEVAQFSGDGLLALFAEPRAAVQAGRDMMEVAELFNAQRSAEGQAAIAFGIGIARGEIVVGSAATARRAAYACVGAPVLSAARLAADGAAAGNGLLMDAATRSGLPADMARAGLNPPATPSRT
nr:response regulator [uncultured Roseateles sp.]